MELFSPTRKAPEFVGIKAWLNTKPLSMKDLRDKVVLVDFWTYTCVNCIRTLPYIRSWHEKYSKKGLVIVGVQSPEFEFEGQPENVKAAIKKLNVNWPVAVDSEMATWKAYANRYWPAKYLVDKDGEIRYTHFGEGHYQETERKIQELLGLKTELTAEKQAAYPAGVSPETYAGSLRGEIGSSGVCLPGGACKYIDRQPHARDVIYLDGEWHQTGEHVEGTGYLAYKFFAREVNIVMDPLNAKTIEIQIDGKKPSSTQTGDDVKNGNLLLDERRMYNAYKSNKAEEHELKMIFKQPARVFAFTFG